ncbi:Yop proteins translocation protein L [Fundidesulfovibrio magnetotacticus]|uniref:Flagellar assembly protein FliH n=1 Tax=Fundidesulfovibrio magnetotacticus TaxID=2730080 RepID=A0A6V8LRZ7_9BACT|nr:FliH/SctL family protein [Fundidesulfovibrio magnetotacticus]GFK93750.1 Yop proteins translocation protein L [Fundidesulfovibrio magnetotacticus]
MSSSSEAHGGFLPGNARVVMGTGANGPAEMTVHEIEGTKTNVLDENTELAFWTRVRAKAQAKAKEIIGQAMAEADELREQARQEGFRQGLSDSRAACSSQMDQMGQALSGLLQGLEADRVNLWARHRQEFAALLRLAVRKTLHVEVSQRRQEVLEALLHQAVDLLDTRQGFTVMVHPGDEEAAAELLKAAREANHALGPWRVKADPSLEAGGVRLESHAGMVDNSVDSRFEQIAELLERVEFTDGEGAP